MGKRNKVLVTGGAGYIGSSLVPVLLEEKFEVTVIDNFMYGNQYALLPVMGNRALTVLNEDVTRLDWRHFVHFDYIIPLAAIVGAPACDKDKTAAVGTNYAAIAQMIKCVKPSTTILYPNTNSGYASGLEGYCDEDSPLDPVSLYGRTKVDGEKSVLSHDNSVVFRLATVFGVSPRMRLDLMVNDFVFRAHHNREISVFDGDYRRNFVGVRDVCRAFIHAMYNRYRGVYNLGLDDANMTKRQLAETVSGMVGGIVTDGKGDDPDKRDYLVSNKKIAKTGFSFKQSLRAGIEDVANFVRIIKPNDKSRFSNV